jgi:hypothetical protein
MSPFIKKLPLNLSVSVEDLGGDCPLGHWTVLGIAGYHEVAAESALPLHHLWTQEISQSTGRTQRYSLRHSIVVQVSTQHAGFLQIVEDLIGVHGLPAALDDGQILLGDGCAVTIAFSE